MLTVGFYTNLMKTGRRSPVPEQAAMEWAAPLR
jgi:hypothetical protein